MIAHNQGGGGRNTTRDAVCWPAVIYAHHPYPGFDPQSDPFVMPRVYDWRPTFNHTPQRLELVSDFGEVPGPPGGQPGPGCFPALSTEWSRAWNVAELYAIKTGHEFGPLPLPMPVIMSRGLLRQIKEVFPCTGVLIVDPQQVVEKLPVFFNVWQDPSSQICEEFPV